MAEQTAEERIMNAWDNKLANKTINALAAAADKNPVIDEHIEDIVKSTLFPNNVSELIDAVNLAESVGLTEDTSIKYILNFCSDPNLLEDAVMAISRGDDDNEVGFILVCVDNNIKGLGYTQKEAEQVAVDWMTCRVNDMSSSIILDDCFTLIDNEDDYDFVPPMSPEQIHAAAEISQQISDLADKKAAEVCKSDADLDNVSYSMKWEMFSALKEQDCFDGSMSPSQMKTLSDSLCRLVEPMVGWDGVNLDVGNNLYAVRDSIMNDREPKTEGVWDKVRKNKEAVTERSATGKSDVREHSADKNQSKDVLEQ